MFPHTDYEKKSVDVLVYTENHRIVKVYPPTSIKTFLNEKYAYEKLHNVTYETPDGRQLSITPQVYEVGKNYIIMEKYDTSLNKELIGGISWWDCGKDETFDQVIECYLRPLLHKLVDLGISHNDVFARNIVIDYNHNYRSIKRLSIIDFGLSTFSKEKGNHEKVEEIIENFKQGLLTSIPDLYD